MNKNIYVIMIASLMMAYSAFGVAEVQSSGSGEEQSSDSQNQQQGRHHHGPRMDEATKAKVDACLAANNIAKPERGQAPPSEADQAKIEACFKESGVSLPPRPGQQGRHRFEDQQPSSDEDQSS